MPFLFHLLSKNYEKFVSAVGNFVSRVWWKLRVHWYIESKLYFRNHHTRHPADILLTSEVVWISQWNSKPFRFCTVRWVSELTFSEVRTWKFILNFFQSQDKAWQLKVLLPEHKLLLAFYTWNNHQTSYDRGNNNNSIIVIGKTKGLPYHLNITRINIFD